MWNGFNFGGVEDVTSPRGWDFLNHLPLFRPSIFLGGYQCFMLQARLERSQRKKL